MFFHAIINLKVEAALYCDYFGKEINFFVLLMVNWGWANMGQFDQIKQGQHYNLTYPNCRLGTELYV